MPAVGYVRSMEMRHDIEADYNMDGSVRRRARAGGCNVTITIEIMNWEGGRPNVMLLLGGETVGVHVLPEVLMGNATAPKKTKRQRRERPAPSSPCLPLPAPRDPSRWDFLEVDDD